MHASKNSSPLAAQDHLGPPIGRPARRLVPRWRARSRFLAVALATMATGIVTVASAGAASAASRVSWLAGAGTIAGVSTVDPATGSYFFNSPTAYGGGASLVASPIKPGYATTPVLTFTSYAQFSADIQQHLITFPYQWVMYDPEKWAQTPLNEQQSPIKYMGLFGQLAHAHGLKVIQAPAMDLAYVSGSVIPRLSRESSAAWYVRVNIAGAAASAGDIFNLQAESQTASLSAYDSLFNSAAAQARAANQAVQVFTELSTSNGTVAQMVAAARSVSPDGFYVAAPGAISEADQFLQQMKAAGY